MNKKGFINQKLGKQTSRRCGIAKLKLQSDRRVHGERILEALTPRRRKKVK